MVRLSLQAEDMHVTASIGKWSPTNKVKPLTHSIPWTSQQVSLHFTSSHHASPEQENEITFFFLMLIFLLTSSSKTSLLHKNWMHYLEANWK